MSILTLFYIKKVKKNTIFFSMFSALLVTRHIVSCFWTRSNFQNTVEKAKLVCKLCEHATDLCRHINVYLCIRWSQEIFCVFFGVNYTLYIHVCWVLFIYLFNASAIYMYHIWPVKNKKLIPSSLKNGL